MPSNHLIFCRSLLLIVSSLVAQTVKHLPAMQETRVWRRSPGEGNGNPLQYSCLENSMDRGAWWSTVHGVAKSRTRLINFTLTFSSYLQSFPASESFLMSQLFTSGGQSIGASASASFLPMNIQGWFPLGLMGLISLLSKGLSRVFSSTTVWKHQFFSTQPSLWSNSHIQTQLQEKP